MNIAHELNDSDCYIPWSEDFKFYINMSILNLKVTFQAEIPSMWNNR
jgi:hypothetical protein